MVDGTSNIDELRHNTMCCQDGHKAHGAGTDVAAIDFYGQDWVTPFKTILHSFTRNNFAMYHTIAAEKCQRLIPRRLYEACRITIHIGQVKKKDEG